MIKDTEIDEEAKDMVEEFQIEYMKKGWELISGTSKFF